MADRLELVPFNHHQIMTVRREDDVFVVMKPIVEALGLGWESQLKRIKRHPVIAEGMSIMTIPSAGGVQQMIALGLEQFHGWLVTLEPGRIADEPRREVLIDYQRRAFRVVFEHFHGSVGYPQRPELPSAAQIGLQNQVLKLIAKLKACRGLEERRALHEMLAALCQRLDMVTPPLAALGQDAPAVPDILAPFWQALETLRARGLEIDHHRRPDLLAINRKYPGISRMRAYRWRSMAR